MILSYWIILRMIGVFIGDRTYVADSYIHPYNITRRWYRKGGIYWRPSARSWLFLISLTRRYCRRGKNKTSDKMRDTAAVSQPTAYWLRTDYCCTLFVASISYRGRQDQNSQNIKILPVCTSTFLRYVHTTLCEEWGPLSAVYLYTVSSTYVCMIRRFHSTMLYCCTDLCFGANPRFRRTSGGVPVAF